jgi:hypothetical protein
MGYNRWDVVVDGKKWLRNISLHAVKDGDATAKYKLAKRGRTFSATVALHGAARTARIAR